MSSKRSTGDGDPGARAAEAEAAREAVDLAFARLRNRADPADPATLAWLAAIDRFRTAVERAYPPTYWDDLARARAGDWSGLETLIGFLEADPWFFRSGYAKETVLKLVKRAPLDAELRARLRAVCLAVVDGRDRREFRDYCRLAAKLGSPEFCAELEARLAAGSEGVRRRAGWMRDALRAAPVDAPER